jgi:hypothetical protein
MSYSIMVGTTDQLTAAIPGSNDNRVTICSTVSCFGPAVITSARTVVRSLPSMSSLRIDCKPTVDWLIVVRSSVRMCASSDARQIIFNSYVVSTGVASGSAG